MLIGRMGSSSSSAEPTASEANAKEATEDILKASFSACGAPVKVLEALNSSRAAGLDAPAAAQPQERQRGTWELAVARSIILYDAPKNTLKFVQSKARSLLTSPGDILYEEGAEPESYYIVQSGLYRATYEPKQGGTANLRDYYPLDSFGSHELLCASKRLTRVAALEGGAVWVIDRRIFEYKLKPSSAMTANERAFLQFCKKGLRSMRFSAPSPSSSHPLLDLS